MTRSLLLAVSGGIDSMYMLHRAPELFAGASFVVAHCNFSLRGEESDADEEFVRNECGKLGIECIVKRFDTLSFARKKGWSVEMAARELRYGWFAQLCRGASSRPFAAVAVAHNANDNAETLLLNLTRGCGSRGLRGMSPSGSVPVEGGSDIMLLRPLLSITRDEIKDWMTTNGFPWREDSSNTDSIHRRNLIRNEIFPLLKELNPSFIRTFGEDMKRIAQTDDIAQDYFTEAKNAVCGDEGIDIPELLGFKHWGYVLWRLLESRSPSQETFGKLVSLLEKYRIEPPGTVTVSGKIFETPLGNIEIRKKKIILA